MAGRDFLGLTTVRAIYQTSVSRISHSVPHKVNVVVRKTKLCLCGLNDRASSSDRVDGIIRNTKTGERDSI